MATSPAFNAFGPGRNFNFQPGFDGGFDPSRPSGVRAPLLARGDLASFIPAPPAPPVTSAPAPGAPQPVTASATPQPIAGIGDNSGFAPPTIGADQQGVVGTRGPDFGFIPDALSPIATPGGQPGPGGQTDPGGTSFSSPRNASIDAFLQALQGISGLRQQGPLPFFPGQTTAGFSPFQQQAFGQTPGAFNFGQDLFGAGAASLFGALDPSSGLNPGAAHLGATTRGDFLSPGTNPFLADTFNQSIAPAIRENVNQSFIGSGRFGSAANTRTLADALGRSANDFFGQNFVRERQNQLQAGQGLAQLGLQTQGLIPGFAQGNFQNLQSLFGFGGAQQQQQQNQLNALRERFEFGRDAPTNLQRQLADLTSRFDPRIFEQQRDPAGTSTTQDLIAGGSGALDIVGQFANIFPSLFGN